MTTVINLNILNVYNLRQNTYSATNLRSRGEDDNYSKYSRPAQERVIDITPEFRALNETVNSRPYKRECQVDRKNALVNNMKNGMYDRNGRTVQYCKAKGMHVDSYA